MKMKWFEFRQFVPRMTCMIDGDAPVIPGGGAPVGDPAPLAPAAPSDPAVAPVNPNAPPSDPAAPPDLAGLQAEIDRLAAENAEPPVDPNSAPTVPGQLPQEFQNISPFVTDSASGERAIRAADEVWKVATGELPARTLVEGIREANPAQFQAIVNDLIPYLEQVTGKKFGGEATPVDPVEKLRSEIAQKEQKQAEAQQQAVYQQQMGQAREVATGKITELLKGTFAEGNETYFLQRCAEKVQIPEATMVRELLAGNTKPLEAALKAVQRDEIVRLKQYNDNLIKKGRNLANSVPATKQTPASAISPGAKRLPGESITEMATRLWKESAPQPAKR
jgi:hypothetical protein